jgi:hypothetical protein
LGYLVNPATYLGLAGYSDSQLTDLLVRASGKADSIMCRSYLPQEIKEEFEGTGTNTLDLGNMPLIFVRSVQLVMPGFAPFTLPVGQLLIDYQRGQIKSWSPMIFQSLGVANAFPRNGLPVIVDYAYGYGYPIPPPSWTYQTGGINGTLAAGSYNFAVTTSTQSGESLPSVPQVITVGANSGANIVITPQPGALTYRIYASQGPNTTLNGAIGSGVSSFVVSSAAGIAPGQTLTLGFGLSDAENVVVASSYVSGTTIPINGTTQNAHASGETVIAAMTLVAESQATNYATATMTVTVVSLGPPSLGALPCPLTDTSAWPVPNGIVEATRVLALAILYEQNNKANRGIYELQSEGRREIWKSTEGQGGLGHPLMVEDAQNMLAPYVYRGLA